MMEIVRRIREYYYPPAFHVRMDGDTIILENADDPDDDRSFVLPVKALKRIRALQCMPVHLIIYLDGHDGHTRVVHEDAQGFDAFLASLRTRLSGFSGSSLDRAKTHDEEMCVLWEDSA
jgi:hypothetical protein